MRKVLIVSMDQSAGHRGQCSEPELGRIPAVVGDPKQASGQVAGLVSRQGQGAHGRDGQWDQLGVRSVAVEQVRQGRDPLGRHLLFAEPRLGHGLQAALAHGPRGRGVAQAGGQELLDRRRLGEAAQLPFQLGSLGGREVGSNQPFTEDAGQRVGPLAMPADDPRRRLLEGGFGRRPAAPRRIAVRGRRRPSGRARPSPHGAREYSGCCRPAAVSLGSAISINA